MNSKHSLILAGMLSAVSLLQAATYYVAPTGSDTTGNGSSINPYQTIQKAVDVSIAGDLVLVSPGTYATGENLSTPASGKSRVVITKNITVRSTHGAQQTVILGQKHSTEADYGANSVRCVFMTMGVLDGFTLRGGMADASSAPLYQPTSSIINGGGVCVPDGNRTPQINNCIITGCSAYRGGGAHWGTLNNCTVYKNYVNTLNCGGGVWSSAVKNSIVMFNLGDNYSVPSNSEDKSLFYYSCTTPLPVPSGSRTKTIRDQGGNITVDPNFITGSCMLARGSPCINIGNNLFASAYAGGLDAAGLPRIVGGSVDMGAYEANFLPYQLTVINGSGSGIYTNGDVVAIGATNAVSQWMTFIGWTGDTGTVANVMLSETTLIMPAGATTVTANYQTAPIDQMINEVLDIPLPIATSNVTVWSVNPAVPSVSLGPIADGDIAFFETVYTNAGTVVFSWNVSSEEGWDFLSFYVDDVLQAQISGEVSGVVTQFVAGAGAHRLKWEYSKDDWPDSWAGDDRGEVGPIAWIPDDLSTELGVPGPLPPPSFVQPGASLPFPYGFAACFLDRNPPAGAVGGMAVKLGGLSGTTPLVPNGQTTAAEVLLNGAGLLSFRCYTACQTYDKIVCTVDGVEKFSMTGDKTRLGAAGWTNVVIELPMPTAHVVRWSYIKDGGGFTAQDAAWVDGVTWTRKTCTLTVHDGSGSGTYLVGDIVTIVGTNVTPLQVFEKWTGDVAYITDVNSMTTTVYMASDLVVQANYKVKYVLTVNGGSGSGSYFGGQVISVEATNMVPGMVFDAWTGDTEYLADPRRGDTTLIMPERNIAITSLLKIEPYLVSVVNGWDAGSWPNAAHEGFGEPQGVYPPDAEVRIVADPAPLWKIFSGWTWTNSLTPVTITDPTADVSSFIMPSNSVTLVANYRDQTDAERLAGALTIRGQPLVISDFSTNGVVALSSGGVRYNDPVVKFGGVSVGRNESVSLTTPSFTGDGILRLWWRGDAEATRDGITVEVNGLSISPFYSEKNTNTADRVVWWLSSWRVLGATTITIRYSRDDSYMVNENFVLVDRVTWMPRPLVDTLDTDYIPNINQESDPCFIAHPKEKTALHDFSGEDGGVRWDAVENAIKLGAFGYQTNSHIAQVGFRPDYDSSRTCIYTWEWKSESEAEYDRLEFLLDLVPTNNFISGKSNVWTPGMFVLKSAYDRKTDLPQSPIKDENVTWPIFTFRYTKDASQSFLRDSTWVRNMSRVLTYGLYIEGGTNTVLVFTNPAFATNPVIQSAAAMGMIPAGTQVTIAANPAPSGMVFAAWSGLLGGVVVPGLPNQTFTMPEQDIVLTATYTAATDPVAVKPQIKSFTLSDTVVKPNQTGLFTAMALATSKSVGMTFEGASAANYEVEWTPSLSGPDCVWMVIPFTSVEVVGTAPGGYTIWSIQATAPSDSTQGFFRLKRKE